MTNIKARIERWNPCLGGRNDEFAAMCEDSNSGQYVRHSDHSATKSSLEARIEELEGALKPFVEEMYETDGSERTDWVYEDDNTCVSHICDLTIGDFRNACRILLKGAGQ